MQQNSPEATLEQVAARYERRLETIRRIQELVRDDPSLASEIAAALNGQGQKLSRRRATTTNVERVKAFLFDRKNDWISAPEIAKALDMSRGTLGQILYQGYANQFEKKAKPGNKKVKLWRLRKEVLS